MIWVIHGNGLVAISAKISEIKKDFANLEINEISAKDESIEQILIKLSTQQLFSEKRLFILIDLEIPLNLTDKVWQSFMNNEGLTVILKFSKSLSANSIVLKNATAYSAQIIKFEEKDEQSVFPFLDNLALKNNNLAFKHFESLFKEYGGQYLLTMIFYMLRRLILKPNKNLPQFVLQKIEQQKRNFNLEKIKKLYLQTLETDYQIKSGLVEERMGLILLVDKILSI